MQRNKEVWPLTGKRESDGNFQGDSQAVTLQRL